MGERGGRELVLREARAQGHRRGEREGEGTEQCIGVRAQWREVKGKSQQDLGYLCGWE